MPQPRSQAVYCSSNLGTLASQLSSTVVRSSFLLCFREYRQINRRHIFPYTSRDLLQTKSPAFPPYSQGLRECSASVENEKYIFGTRLISTALFSRSKREGEAEITLHSPNSAFIPQPFLKPWRCYSFCFQTLSFPILQISLTRGLIIREESKNVHLIYLVQHIPNG